MISSWFLNKNFTENERLVIESADIFVEKETEKAVYVKFSSDYGTIKKWIPKSCFTLTSTTKNIAKVEKEETTTNGQKIKLIDGEIKEVASINGVIVTTIDGGRYVKHKVEFI